MATRAGTLTGATPATLLDRPILMTLWLAAAAVVLASVLVAAVIVGRATPTRTEPASPGVKVTDTTGPGAPAHQQITVNGRVCGQCR